MGSDGHFLPALGTSFHDFAGSTVVHTIGGFVALADPSFSARASGANSNATAAVRCCRTI